jgi:3-hydroxybutyryl-CoA dehydratase
VNNFIFSDMIVGKKESLEVQVGEHEIAAFAELSGDVSPIHVDDGFAIRKGFKSRIAHGALLVSYASKFIGTIMPGASGLLQSVAMDFRRPCYPGTRVKIEGEVAKRVESVRVVRIKMIMTDVMTGEILATGMAQLSITDGKTAGIARGGLA